MLSGRRRRLAAGFLALVAILGGAVSGRADGNAPSAVELVARTDGGWELRRGGEPWPVRGVGGTERLVLAQAIGANTVRTWGIEDLARPVDGVPLVDRAAELGLAVVAGIWLGHERHGFDYRDAEQVQAQRERVRLAVRTYRHHPAILMWGIGNEMEGAADRPDAAVVWEEVEHLLRVVKEEDPSRPVMTVIAGAAPAKLAAIQRHLPSLDVLGVNLYGAAPRVAALLDAAGWNRPFLLTEYGPAGPWEVSHTPWGAPVEPSSEEKVAIYARSLREASRDPAGRCLGTFAFHWGQKQEATGTWFGLFLATGETTPMVDRLAEEFGRAPTGNRSPRVRSLQVPFAHGTVARGAEAEVAVEAYDPDGNELSFHWVVQAESHDRREGGDREAIPPEFPGCVIEDHGATARIRAPQRTGAYRLFVYVRDGQGGGVSENVTFFVQ